MHCQRTIARSAALPTVADDVIEVARHADAMNSYANHVWDRCGEMLGAANGGSCCGWSPAMSGCPEWDGEGGIPHGVWDGGMMYDAGMAWDSGGQHEGSMMGGGVMGRGR